MVFFSKQKVQVARSYAPLKLIDFFLLTMATRLIEDESDFEGKGIYSYMPEAAVARLVGMASGGALDYDEDSDMDNGDAS